MSGKFDDGDIPVGLRKFVATEVVPAAAGWDRSGALPGEMMATLGRRGWLGSFLERSEGGIGLDMVSYGRLHEELGRGCSSLRGAVTAHDMVILVLRRWGETKQKDRWLRRLLRGDAIAGFALSEAGAGSDASAIRTEARREKAGFIFRGSKRWVTNGLRADVYLVFARTAEGTGAFLIPRKTAGLTVTPMGPLLGVRAAGIAELRFEDCNLSADVLIGGPGGGLNFVLPAGLALGRYAVACGCLGMVRACLAAAIAHARARTQADVVLSSHQLVRRMLARMIVGSRAVGVFCRRCGELLQSGSPGAMLETAIAKYLASQVAREATADSVQICGGEGCLEGHIVERFFRDAKVMEIVEGATEVLEMLIAGHGMREQVAAASDTDE